MMTALNQLGYKCYHMTEAGATENIKQRHCICWREALKYKVYGIGKAYGPKYFDKMLQNYSVSHFPKAPESRVLTTENRPSRTCHVSTSPTSLLPPFLPNAKVVLTQREPESWVRSIDISISSVLS